MALALRTHCGAILAALMATAGVAEAGYGFLVRASGGSAEQQLMAELTARLGHGASRERLARLEDVMRPMYMSLPKQKDGGIDRGLARYALHRYFLAHRGWHITGIAHDGERWNATSSTAMLKSKMPTSTMELLEEHVVRKRLGLGELAVLAATVEDLVHSDALELLAMAYGAHNLSMHEPLEDEAKEDLVIKTFMLFYIMPWTQKDRTNSTALRKHVETAHNPNPTWKDAMLWLEDLKGANQYQHRADHNPFSKKEAGFGDYPSMVRLAEQIIDGYGMFQDIQCRELKNELLDLETQERNDGRVLLANFYRPFVKGIHSMFTERPEYLKSLGSLDESDLERPSVIVPNFLYGRNFCIATENDFQSFCCIDQCNMLMESLERSIAHPVAEPSLIVELVSAIPSDTVAAPRNLSGSLRRKLDTIAEQNGGHVPLHGRLFAQWLHHAFPNECQQPRAPGVTEAPMTHDEWQARRNTSASAPREVVQNLTRLAGETEGAVGQDETCMLWTEEEELITSVEVSPRAERPYRQEGMLYCAVRFLAMCGAVGSLIAILFEKVIAARSCLQPQGCKKTSVCV